MALLQSRFPEMRGLVTFFRGEEWLRFSEEKDGFAFQGRRMALLLKGEEKKDGFASGRRGEEEGNRIFQRRRQSRFWLFRGEGGAFSETLFGF